MQIHRLHLQHIYFRAFPPNAVKIFLPFRYLLHCKHIIGFIFIQNFFEYQVIALVLSVVNELHQYHKTVAECIAPIVEYSAYRKRNHSKYEMKECSSVPVTWKAVNEVIICNFCKKIVFGLKDSILFCCASI